MSSSFGDNKRKPGATAAAVTEARRLSTLAQTWTFQSKAPRVTTGTQVAAVMARNAGVLALKYAEQNGSQATGNSTNTTTTTNNDNDYTFNYDAGYLPPVLTNGTTADMTTDRKWAAVNSSYDGIVIVGTVITNLGVKTVYISTDSGSTFKEITLETSFNRFWAQPGCSYGGRTIVLANDYQELFISKDSGNTFSRSRDIVNYPDYSWKYIASYNDGSKFYITSGSGPIFNVIYDGSKFIFSQLQNAHPRSGLCCSGDGKIVATCGKDHTLHVSEDSGVSWKSPGGSLNFNWVGITCSPDGTKIFAAIDGGYIYRSLDKGTSWTRLDQAGSRNWSSISYSRTSSTTVVATVKNGPIYFSIDTGDNWHDVSESESLDWSSSVVSTTGEAGISRVIASVMDGRIYQYNFGIA